MNMIDYLKWRGDLTFSQSEFNEVDNLLLCYLIYVNLDGVAPGEGESPITIRELSERFFGKYGEEELKKDKSFIRFAPAVLHEMAKTSRFGTLRVKNYVNKIDLEKMLQFAAMEICLSDDSSFIAYRGTDDTIVGWKEDFFLSRGKVLAEEEAVSYLNRVGMSARKTILDKLFPERYASKSVKLRIGGHSKGGHLAIHAAAYCDLDIQDRILEVYSNDGPGFLQNVENDCKLQAVRKKVKRIVPEYSVIGMLMNPVCDPVIVRSTQKTIMQHDGFSWEVEGPAFVKVKELSNFSVVLDEAIRAWLDGIPEWQREAVIQDLFAVLEATGAETLTELQDGGMKNFRILVKRIDGMDSESKIILQDLLKEIVQRVPQLLGMSERIGGIKKRNETDSAL